jgi:hypothetical protein
MNSQECLYFKMRVIHKHIVIWHKCRKENGHGVRSTRAFHDCICICNHHKVATIGRYVRRCIEKNQFPELRSFLQSSTSSSTRVQTVKLALLLRCSCSRDGNESGSDQVDRKSDL